MALNFSKSTLPSSKFKVLLKPITTSSSSSDIVNTLLNSQTPQRALSLFKQAISMPLSNAELSQLYAAIIHITTSAQMYPLANSITKQLIACSGNRCTVLDALRGFVGPKSSSKVFDVLIVSFSQLNLVNQAAQVFYQMKVLPVVQACNCLLNAVLKSGRVSYVWKLFDEMLRRRVQPNVFTYNILINACRYQGDGDEKDRPNCSYLHTIIICGKCESGDVNGAIEKFERMKESGVHPNFCTCNALIDVYFKNGDIGEGLALYGKMIEDGLIPNDVSFATLIDGLCKHRRINDARDIFHVDMARFGVLKMAPIYNCLIDGYCKFGNLNEAFKLFAQMRKVGLPPDSVTYGILIKGLCDTKRVGEAADVLLKMRQDGIPANSVIYNTVIDGRCKEGDLNKAMETCLQMSKEGVGPNLITFSSLVDGHSKKGEMEAAMRIYTEMVAKDFKLDVVTYTTLIDGYSKHGNADKMLSIKKEMEENDVKPNVVTNTSLINGLFREGLTRDAIDLNLEKIKFPDFKPNNKTYMVLMYGMYRAGLYFKAGRFYLSMRSSGLVPDAVTYLLLMRGQCKMGYVLNAMTLQADMLKTGAMAEDW
ncbi:uncharacterized protein A4U43_C05F31380 [Asparagus officinalis]|uniref:Pentacotripeptide-repeat region of PRORP domain-containing protein n=1 Tax=Asparagus officinalis TaxID=4686 RepID=A0A5P1EVU4_ASPOF|nr:uncharacterized protein A4U43_C05F31380 [Asparagus officinalis]